MGLFWSQNWSVEIWCPDHIPKLGVGPVSVFFIGSAALETGPACPRNAFPKTSLFSRFDHSKSAFNSFANYCEMISAYFYRKVQRFCAMCKKHFINQNSESTQQAASTYWSGGNTCFMGNNGASISVIPHLSSDLFFDRKWPKITLI